MPHLTDFQRSFFMRLVRVTPACSALCSGPRMPLGRDVKTPRTAGPPKQLRVRHLDLLPALPVR